MADTIENILSSIPEATLPLVIMNNADNPIEIYEGLFYISEEKSRFSCNGKIVFWWRPTPHIKFTGNLDYSSEFIQNRINHVNETTLSIDGLLKSRAIISHNTLQQNVQPIPIEGQLVGDITWGDENKLVDTVRFEIANFDQLIGESIRQGYSISKGRMTFEDMEYTIHIDQLADLDSRLNLLNRQGGFCFTHAGILIPKAKVISLPECQQTLQTLFWLLSFIAGRRTGPMFISGVKNGEVQWRKFNPFPVDSYRPVWSWPDKLHTQGIPKLWKPVKDILGEKEGDWLSTALQFYVIANRKEQIAETALIVAQSCLELLVNRIVIEEKKANTGKIATQKIKALLDIYNLTAGVPPELRNTTSFEPTKDGPSVITSIRNLIVHNSKDKRLMLSKIPGPVRAEALNLALLYIELVLLHRLGYSGAYFNRCIEVVYD